MMIVHGKTGLAASLAILVMARPEHDEGMSATELTMHDYMPGERCNALKLMRRLVLLGYVEPAYKCPIRRGTVWQLTENGYKAATCIERMFESAIGV